MKEKNKSQKNNIKIFATVGPSTYSSKNLDQLKSRVDYIRINLSHTDINKIESSLKRMLKSGATVVIDTEGSQVRTGDLGTPINLREGDDVKIFNKQIKCNSKQFYVRPQEFLGFVNDGDLISVDFDSVLLKVSEVENLKKGGYVKTKVLIGGNIGNNKAVHSDSVSKLPAFSQKDMLAIELAKKNKIKYFTLSYIDNAEEVLDFKKMYPSAIAYSKVETKSAVVNFDKILKVSDGILIDRGDLSREVPMENIPLLQKAIIHRGNQRNKPIFIATNILENMCDHLKPERSEVSDIVNAILDGVNGFVLTKETAVGKYPIQTINVLKGIISRADTYLDASSTDLLKIAEERSFGNLVEPHGGTLVNRYQQIEFSDAEVKQFKKIKIDEEIMMDLEQIAFGAYSPLEGFMNFKEMSSVLDKMRLTSGIPWPMPILLTASKKDLKGIKTREIISLVRKEDNQIYATLVVDEMKKIDKLLLCKKWFGTSDRKHPGVQKVIGGGEYLVAGKINLLKRRPSPFKEYELTPVQTRKIFTEKDWTKVVGFHSRNPIHKSHEYIQLHALRESQADGLLVHPVVGKKKKGDFDTKVIISVYELMMKKFYPKDKVVFAVYPTYSRYAGPREAIFTAICRKNYGCSHFIVGRDHTGVGDYYFPQASQEIFNKFPDLGITPIFFPKVYFSKKLKKHVAEGQVDEPEESKESISGTEIREIFKEGRKPPDWLMRPQIVEQILKLRKEFKHVGKSIFVE